MEEFKDYEQKTVKLKPGDTVLGLFDKIKAGQIFHVKVNNESMRVYAGRLNSELRRHNVIGKYDKRFRTSRTLKKGYTSLIYEKTT